MPEGMSFKENIVNFAPDGVPGGAASSSGSDPEAEKKAKRQKEFDERKESSNYFGREGSSWDDLLRNAETPDQVRLAYNEVMDVYVEKSAVPESTKSEYSIKELASICLDRESALRTPVDKLVERGIVSGIFTDKDGRIKGEAKFGGYAIRKESHSSRDISKAKKIPVSIQEDKDGNIIQTEFRLEFPEISDFGKDQTERNILADAYKEAAQIMMTRKLLADQHAYYFGNTENIDGLANFYLFTLPTNEGMKALFNAAGTEKNTTVNDGRTQGGVEYRKGHEQGDMLDSVIRLYTLISLSERPEEMKELIKDPFFDKLFDRENPEYLDNIRAWLGAVDKFKQSNDQSIVKNGFYTEKDAVYKEREITLSDGGKIGGELTKYGNIFVETGTSHFEYVTKIRKAVTRFIGRSENDPDAIRAEKQGFELFQLWMMASENGWEKYIKESGVVETNHDMGNPMTDDFVKVIHPEMFQEIYTRKKRDAGPKESRGKYLGFTVSFLRAITVDNPYGEGKRSLYELWKGYKPDSNGGAEPALRIGEFDWSDMVPKILNKFYLSAFMAGRKDIGIYQHVTRDVWRADEIADPSFWEKLNKYIGVGVGESVTEKGVFRGTTKEGRKKKNENYKKEIIRNFLEGVMNSPQGGRWAFETVSRAKKGARDRKGDSELDFVKYIDEEVIPRSGVLGE